MNGPQDVGGMMGFGPVAPEANEPIFHAEWEGRALGVTLAAGALGTWPLDETRLSRESLPPAVYYSSSYYEIWTRALENQLVKHGLVTPEELAAGNADPRPAHEKQLRPEMVAPSLAKGKPTERNLDSTPRFVPGDRVRARNIHPKGHVRLPRYLRGHIGVIEADHGGHVFPDTNAHGLGEQPQRLYTVVFDGAEVWGEGCEPGLTISADLWESYLENA